MKYFLSLLFIFLSCHTYSQKLLTAWGQKDIENYNKEMYDAAQKLSAAQLLTKNINDKTWADVFLTLNASVNLYSKDTSYLKALAVQVANGKETMLAGTSRLIIWDRIISGDIIFEGKGLIFNNDLYKVGGRANQLLQTLTRMNFGEIGKNTTEKELKVMSEKWLQFLSNRPVQEFKPYVYKNAKIPEISSPNAIHAMILSLQNNDRKQQIIKKCLKLVYNLDELPIDKNAQANYCNPDQYTFSYLGMLFGEKTYDEKKDAQWWLSFWDKTHERLVWNDDKGIYEVNK